MPLISSPIDGSPMREIERYGVKMDICPTSGGIWLDKGELEKIIMMIRQEALQEGGGHSAPPPPPGGYDGRYRSQSQPQYRDRDYREERSPRRKKRDSIFENIMDIFD